VTFCENRQEFSGYLWDLMGGDRQTWPLNEGDIRSDSSLK
jgi:hypothetical protein